jgi:hypothetical protein
VPITYGNRANLALDARDMKSSKDLDEKKSIYNNVSTFVEWVEYMFVTSL